MIENTKRRYLFQDGYPQNLITGYKISNKLLHFNETHKTRDPKTAENIKGYLKTNPKMKIFRDRLSQIEACHHVIRLIFQF